MKSKEQAVRDAAVAFKTAIDEAAAEGLHTQWPTNAEGLPSIAISETGKARQPAAKADEKPTKKSAVKAD